MLANYFKLKNHFVNVSLDFFDKFTNFFGLSQKPMMGMVIGSESVVLLELATAFVNENNHDNKSKTIKGLQGKRAEHYYLKSFATEPLGAHAIVDNKILDIASIAETIDKTLVAAKTETTRVAIALPDALIFKRILQVPNHFKEEEILEHIEMDAERYLPPPFEELCFDFKVINPDNCNNSHGLQNNINASTAVSSNTKIKSKTKEVLLVATRIETVETYIEVLELAGLKAAVMDVESIAMERGELFMRDHFSEWVDHALSSWIDPVKIKKECPNFQCALGVALRTFDKKF